VVLRIRSRTLPSCPGWWAPPSYHSLAVTDKRGLFKSWTLLAVRGRVFIKPAGTFLVRSGVLVSVHSFASDPARGIFILSFLALMIGGALTLLRGVRPVWAPPPVSKSSSRESFLLFNNILLVVAAAVVFGGTLAPLIADTLRLGTLSVGPPYFNPSFLVPTLPLVMLVSIGIHSRLASRRARESRRRILGALAAALLIGLAVTYGFYGGASLLTPVGAVVGFWIILSSLIDPIDRLRRHLTLPASVLGMTIAHIGLGCFVLGITFVKSNTIEMDVAAGAWGQPAGRWLHVPLQRRGEHRGPPPPPARPRRRRQTPPPAARRAPAPTPRALPRVPAAPDPTPPPRRAADRAPPPRPPPAPAPTPAPDAPRDRPRTPRRHPANPPPRARRTRPSPPRPRPRRNPPAPDPRPPNDDPAPRAPDAARRSTDPTRPARRPPRRRAELRRLSRHRDRVRNGKSRPLNSATGEAPLFRAGIGHDRGGD